MSAERGVLKTSQLQQNFEALFTHLLSDYVLSNVDEVEPFIEKGLKSVAEFYGVDESFIGLFDDTKNHWSYIYNWTKNGGLVTEDDPNTLPLMLFPWSNKRVRAGKDIRVNNVSENKLLRGKPDYEVICTAGIKSILIEPLSVMRKVIPGVVALWSKDHYVEWTDKDARNLRLLGDVLANLVDRKQREIERDKRERYITLLNKFTQYAFDKSDHENTLSKMAEDLLELTGADFCGFGVWDENRKTITPLGVAGTKTDAYLKIGETQAAGTMTEYVLKTGKVLILENVAESRFRNNPIVQNIPMKSLIVIPIKTIKNLIGSVIVGFSACRAFTKQDLEMFQQAAAQITLSLSNIQAYQDNVQHIEEMNTLSILSTALRKAQSLSEIPVKVIDRILAMRLAESAGMVIFTDPEKSPNLIEGGGSWKNDTKDQLSSKLLPIVEKAMKTGKVVLDDEFESGKGSHSVQGEEPIRHVLGFPLKANLQTLGAFCVGSSTSFNEKRISLLNAVSETVANAVYRQSVFDSMQVHLETLRATKIQLVQSEKLAAIGELVAGVAHELNNPLTTITLSAELLLQQSVNEQDIYDLGKIVSESQRAAKIVKSLLDFSRQHAPERQPVEINPLLKSTTDLVSWELVKNNINWRLSFASDLPVTVADPNQLKQVFINVINNSVQAIKKHRKSGEILLTTEVGPSLFFGTGSKEDDVIRIIFSDSGPGIPPAVLPKIFDPFFTTKSANEGTGLGLSVCHGIITEHKGHIWAENIDEGGARILIEIPIIQPDKTTKNYDNYLKSKAATSEHLLIIEDEESVLEVMHRALMRKGFIVDGVGSGAEGLECIKNNTYALIICDIRMSGMNGFEFYQAATRIDPRLGKMIVFTSGDSVKPEYSNFIKLTGATFIPKPFELSHLVNVVQEKIASLKHG
jgi:signal transduction histidine kinase/ActR/RegA family two-component response regulator/putative methionine-R-sulfoxide reductase with GAF domain